MQLSHEPSPVRPGGLPEQRSRPSRGLIRPRLHAAACLLLAAGVPAAAAAQAAAHATAQDAARAAAQAAAQAQDSPKWSIAGAALYYQEKARTKVVEPIARISRLFRDGRTLTAQFAFDTITGASPSGAQPTGDVQTTTTPSGNVRTVSAGQVPLSEFHDTRRALDLDWLQPLGSHVKVTAGGHISKEKDYLLRGGNGKISIDTMQRLTTLTAGIGINRDRVNPVNGIPIGLTDTAAPRAGGASSPKRSTTWMAGISRILTRRCMAALDFSRTAERGYLTEPYKVISLLDLVSGKPTSEINELRPSQRNRSDILAGTVYHLTTDILYANYRYYWDDWGVRSHTIEVRYRHAEQNQRWLQPHIRAYIQSQADFFHFGIPEHTGLPVYATSDYRLGPLRSVTLGATYGFHVPNTPGEFSVRGEYIRQSGNGHPLDAIGIQSSLDLFPLVETVTLMVSYSVKV